MKRRKRNYLKSIVTSFPVRSLRFSLFRGHILSETELAGIPRPDLMNFESIFSKGRFHFNELFFSQKAKNAGTVFNYSYWMSQYCLCYRVMLIFSCIQEPKLTTKPVTLLGSCDWVIGGGGGGCKIISLQIE